MSHTHLLEKNGLRILCVAEIRGHLSLLNHLADEYQASIIIHTGSFGFFDNDSISKIHESYLRHIIAFCPLLDEEIVNKVSELSKIDNSNNSNNEDIETDLKKVLQDVKISELMDFVLGYKSLKIPVYTIYGMVEDSTVIDKFKMKIYSIPNLFILDEVSTYRIKSPIDDTKIQLCGIGGSLSYQKLFHHGTFDNELNYQYDFYKESINSDFLPVSGDPGNIWITMVQLGQFIKTLEENYSSQDIRIMVTHSSPSRDGLLGHLAVVTKMDYTISNGLHFLYPSSFNELTICPNFEFYKSKFSEARNQLSAIWLNVAKTVEQIAMNNDPLTDLLNVALSTFDKIPVMNSNNNKSDEIIPIALSNFKRDINSNIIRLQNDAYYVAFQNIWHFNLCDVSIGSVVLDVIDGNFQFQANSKGFNFKYRENLDENNINSNGTNGLGVGMPSPNSQNGKFRGSNGNSRGRGSRGRGGFRKF